jgi:hypothetical protein
LKQAVIKIAEELSHRKNLSGGSDSSSGSTEDDIFNVALFEEEF